MIRVEPVKQWTGRRMKKAGYRAYIGSLCADGKTPTEAREAVLRQAEKALTEDWEPYVVVAHGWIGIAFKDHGGWTYTVQPMEEFASGKKVRGLVVGAMTREEAIRKMLRHLIQNVGPEALHLAADANMREDLERYFRTVEEMRTKAS